MEDGECATEGAEGQTVGRARPVLGFTWQIGAQGSTRLRVADRYNAAEAAAALVNDRQGENPCADWMTFPTI